MLQSRKCPGERKFGFGSACSTGREGVLGEVDLEHVGKESEQKNRWRRFFFLKHGGCGMGWGGCWCSLVLRGNISKVRRKSCQINFSPFQSRPGEFLSHFTSADLGPFFSASVGLTLHKDPAPSYQPQKNSESFVNGN